MTISSGNLDGLLNQTSTVQSLANLTYLSGTASNGTVTSVTAKTGAATYASFDSLKITSVNDANNNIVVTGYFTSTGSGGYGGGGYDTTNGVPWNFTVIGQSGNDLLLAANGSAAVTSLSESAVAADIQSGNATLLSSDLFVLTTDGTQISTDATPQQTLTFTALPAPVETAAQATASPPGGQVAISDSAANVNADLDALQSLFAAGKITGITLTDSGIPSLSVSAAQATNDAQLLKDIGTNYTLTIDGTAANITASGIAGHGTIVKFSGMADQYTVTPAGDGVNFTVTDTSTGRASIDHLGTVTALQFSDFTDFIANAPSNTGITTGNVTEIYAAVLGRVPDVPGLAYYQQLAATTPSLTLSQLAQNFLSSPEYVNNTAHNYAQSAAGDAQFVTDTYANLLHRAPEAGAVAFYQSVIAQFTNGLTPGTAAYAAAALAGHAQVLVDFSASPEYLGDVQITAQHPADAQHFLYVI